MENKQWVYVVLGVSVFIFLIFLISNNYLSITSSTFTPVYCNDYSLTCCVEYAATDPRSMEFTTSRTSLYRCDLDSERCEIDGISTNGASLVVASADSTCQYLTGLLTFDRWSCSNVVRSQTSGDLVMQPGQYLYASPVIGGASADFVMTVIKKHLVFTGRAGGEVGVLTPGASECSFNPSASFTATGELIDFDPNLQSTVVNKGLCVLSWTSGDRHICGNVEEECNTDSDCAYHTYGDKECIGKTLVTYGCRDYSSTLLGLTPYLGGYANEVWGDSPVNLGRMVEEGSSTDASREVTSGIGSRCEAKGTAIPVECCGDSDCGSNAFCDISTFTCKSQGEVACTVDWECGISQTCDSATKTLREPDCNSLGRCVYNVVKNVQCCSPNDCQSGYTCDSDNVCKQSVPGIGICPYECCPAEGSNDNDRFYERACGAGEVCTQNNICSVDPDSNDIKWAYIIIGIITFIVLAILLVVLRPYIELILKVIKK